MRATATLVLAAALGGCLVRYLPEMSSGGNHTSSDDGVSVPPRRMRRVTGTRRPGPRASRWRRRSRYRADRAS